MRFDANPMTAFQRAPADAEKEAHKTTAVERVDSPISTDKVSEDSRRLSTRAARHTRQIWYADHAYTVADAEFLSLAVPAPCRHWPGSDV